MDTKDSEDKEIIEAEIVKEDVSSSSDQATVLLSLEQLVKSHIASIDQLKVENKKYKQMLEDALVGDVVYQEHDKAAKEAAKQKGATKLQILKQPANLTLSNKIKSISSELKEKQIALSDYLLEYQRLSGATEIEGEDGELREIVHTAKVIKRSS